MPRHYGVRQEQSRGESEDFQIVRRLEPDPGWKLLLLELICVKTERRVVDQRDTQVEKFDENGGKAALHDVAVGAAKGP